MLCAVKSQAQIAFISGMFLSSQYFVDQMEGSPRSSQQEAEEDQENTHQEEEENATAQLQEEIFFNQEPDLISGDILRETIHRSIGALTFLTKDNKLGVGSGVLVSRNIVLSAAHNIFNTQTNSENTEFKFYLRADGETGEYYQVEAWRFPEEFKAHSSSPKLQYDYAIMKIKKPYRFEEYPKLKLACSKCLCRFNNRIMLQVYGFSVGYPPGHSDFGKGNFELLSPQENEIKLNQYGSAHSGRIAVIDVEQAKIGYKIRAFPGQNGCPVIVDDSIVAVHVGECGEPFNTGRIVDVSFIESLWKWREELHASPFKLENRQCCTYLYEILRKLKYQLDFSKKGIKSMDLRAYGNLMELDLSKNELRQIDISNCPRLTKLNLNRNHLQLVNLTENKHLVYLNLQANQLQEIDLRTNVNITYLNLSYNMLQEADITTNVQMNDLNLSKNKLRKINLHANVNLTLLSLSQNCLQEVDVRANVNLIMLNLSQNRLQKIDIENNINLSELYLNQNELTEIDITKCTKIEYLRLSMNRLVRIRLIISEQVPQRKYIRFFDLSNQLSAVCRVQLLCEEQTKQFREKAIKIIDNWKNEYSKDYTNNRNCAYSFLAF